MSRKRWTSGTVIALWIVVGVVPCWGQIAIPLADVAPQVGTEAVYSMYTVIGTMDATGNPVGDSGGPHTSDFTAWGDGAGAMMTGTIATSVLPAEAAPTADDFPDADYAIYLETEFTLLTGEFQQDSGYFFMKRTPLGDVPLGGTNPELVPSFAQVQTQNAAIYPLTFGKTWGFTQSVEDLGISLPEGMTVSGSLDVQGHVDAWGTAITPVGTFECLRIYQRLEGTIGYGGTFGSGEMPMTIESYQWLSREVGPVAIVQEIRMGPSTLLPETTMTQVMLLTSFSQTITPVESATWGQIKNAVSNE